MVTANEPGCPRPRVRVRHQRLRPVLSLSKGLAQRTILSVCRAFAPPRALAARLPMALASPPPRALSRTRLGPTTHPSKARTQRSQTPATASTAETPPQPPLGHHVWSTRTPARPAPQ